MGGKLLAFNSTEEIIAAINALTEEQQDVLGYIAVGQSGGYHPKTLEILLKNGLVDFKEIKQADRFGMFTFNEFFVPLPIHFAWCKWCAEKNSDEEGEKNANS